LSLGSVIDLSGTSITDRSLEYLAQSTQLKYCTGLSLRKCSAIVDTGIQALAVSADLLNLLALDLSETPITNRGLYALSSSSSLLNLNLLNLSCCKHLGDEGVKTLLISPTARHLSELDLSYTIISDETLQYISRHGVCMSLSSLILRVCSEITDEGMVSLVNSDLVSNLQTLNIGFTKIGNQTLRSIAESKNMSLLKSLIISSCERVTDDGLSNLANSPQITNLQNLDMKGLNISNISLVEISQSKTLTNLNSLNLSYCSMVSDQGILAISSSSMLINLRHLDLSSTDLSRHALEEMTLTHVFHNLTTLSLISCVNIVSDLQLINRMKLKFPYLEIRTRKPKFT
jgi:hypothetical protein